MKLKTLMYISFFAIFAASCNESVLQVDKTPTDGLKAAAIGNSYYVAKNGSDSNPGTLASPWLTITHAMQALYNTTSPSIFIRQGTYNERFTVYLINGTAAAPAVIAPYQNEKVIIDGTGTDNGIVVIYGNYIKFSGFEIKSSSAGYNDGISTRGNNITVSNCIVHDVVGGIYIQGDGSTGCIVEYNEVYNASMDNSVYPGKNGYINSVGITVARGNPRVNHNIVRHNNVHDVWGEGISTFEANYSTIEDNIVHDCWSTNIYISDSSFPLVQRNFVYKTKNLIGTGGIASYEGKQVGILMGDEKVNPGSDHTQVLDNLVYGCQRNFHFWGSNGSNDINNLLIANNTFVNSTSDSGDGYNSNVSIAKYGTPVNVIFKNNIIIQNGTVDPYVGYSSANGVQFSNNLWYSTNTHLAGATGSGDIIADPKLANISSSRVVTNPYDANSYKLLSSSPAINVGTNLGITTDFLSNAVVGLPDIGAYEYTTAVSSSPTTVTTYYNAQISATAIKNSCGTGYTGSTVTYSVAANKYSSTISQADADNKALADLTANKQTYANANGACTASTATVFYNIQTSSTATKNTCGTGYIGSTVTYTVSANKYSSTVSQVDANNKALADINTNKQAYANANGTCTIISSKTKIYYNVEKSAQADKNDCPSGRPGSMKTYVVYARTYSSTVSQAAADALATNDVNANKQAYANQYGICF